MPFDSGSCEIQLYPFALADRKGVPAPKRTVKCAAGSSWAEREERASGWSRVRGKGVEVREGSRHPPSTAENTLLFIKA